MARGYEALRGDAAFVDLSSRGRIRVTGEDRARLLHAMSTNDVKGLAEGTGLYAFFLSAQGRILGDACIYNLGDSLLLDTEPELRAKLFEHLDKFIIADDALLEDETDAFACVAIEGPSATQRATALGIPFSAEPFGVEPFRTGFTVRTSAFATDGVRVFLPVAEKAALVKRLSAELPEAFAEDARIVRLENGKARYGEDITERYLVQETQLLSAVSFNKGCYIGQEIVERVRSRAQVHRHLRAIRITGQSVPEPGTKLMSGDAVVGEITSAAYSPALGEGVGLAYVRTEAEQNLPMMQFGEAGEARVI